GAGPYGDVEVLIASGVVCVGVVKSEFAPGHGLEFGFFPTAVGPGAELSDEVADDVAVFSDEPTAVVVGFFAEFTSFDDTVGHTAVCAVVAGERVAVACPRGAEEDVGVGDVFGHEGAALDHHGGGEGAGAGAGLAGRKPIF